MSIQALIHAKQNQQFELYDQYLNQQLLNVLKTLGFDKKYVKAKNQYLYDEYGDQYLDLLSGYGVYLFGRNHPQVIHALKESLDLDLANMVQFDCPLLAASFAEKLAKWLPADLEKFYFCNSGTEAIEAAVKFSRAATNRPGVLYCKNAFHGLTMGSLSINGSDFFKKNYLPLLPGATQIPFNDLLALENALKSQQFACFVLEPIQGKGVNIPDENYLSSVSILCKKYKTLLVIDEIQTGIGRTGQFFAFEHWQGVHPDLITMAKALSGGFIPVGVVAMKKWIFNKTYSSMEQAVVHSCTYGRNNLAMVAGITTLEIVDKERLIQQAGEKGKQLLARLQEALLPFEMVKVVRGKGMMIGIEFCAPRSLSLKAGWKLLEMASKGLFCQMIVIPLFTQFRMLTQVAGHQSYVIKLIPPVTITDKDIDDVVQAITTVVAQAHRFPGAIWDLGKTLAKHALLGKKSKKRSEVEAIS